MTLVVLALWSLVSVGLALALGRVIHLRDAWG